jgi:hypothetical protein
MTTTLALGAALVVSIALAPPPAPPPAVGIADAARLVSFKGTRSVLHCLHAEWAADFARANGTVATPKVRPWRFKTAALVLSGILTPLAAVGVWVNANPSVYIDNAGSEPLAIWIDGEKVTTAQPTRREAKPSYISVPHGQHRFGYSPVGASAPQATVDARVTMFDAHLYNPGKTACYWLVANTYGSASAAGLSRGPQLIREFYTFNKVDTWFGENPQSIQVSNGQSGGTRIALQRASACMALAARGCDSDARTKFIECERAATSDAAMDACDEQVTCGAQSLPTFGQKTPPTSTAIATAPARPAPAPPAKPAVTHAASAVPRPTAPPAPAPAKSK